jgi:hypothetical protein
MHIVAGKRAPKWALTAIQLSSMQSWYQDDARNGLVSALLLTIASATHGAQVGVAAIDDLSHSIGGLVHSGGLASNGDLHRVAGLVDLDVSAKVLLQGLDGLAALSNHAADHPLGALHLACHASTVLQPHQKHRDQLCS